MHRKRLVRPLVGLVACVAGVAALTLVGTGITAGKAGPKSNFSKEDRAALVKQIAAGERTATLLIAATSSSVADAVRGLGGTVTYRDDRVGYLRVTVPVGAADDVARIQGIAAIDVDRLIPQPNPRPQVTGVEPNVDPPGATTPNLNPYMPTKDTGAAQFVQANPRFDGRGITVGIVDTGVDLLTPELQTAKKDDGKSIPKIKDWVNFNHPVDDGDPTWVDMATQVKGRGGTFTVGGLTYTTPKGQGGGNFRFGLFRENGMVGGVSEWTGCGSAARADVDRDGVCGESIALLWDGDEKVWVDTNQDRSFANEKAMEQFSKKRDFAILGTDNPATPARRESVPFTVQADEKTNRVNLGVVSQAHGTHVAGIAAGKDFLGGQFDGAAPEAQIVAVNVCVPQGGCTFHGLIEGMTYAIADAKSDVVNMSIGGLSALNDGNSVFGETYKRLMKDHNVQLFLSAGNSGPGFNTIGNPSDTDGVMSVGAHITKESFESNYGAITVLDEQLHPFSSRGPLENGAFKPNIIAPGNAVSTIPAWQGQSCLPYVCPAGYALFNGTSMASPQAAGAAALLLSAAKLGSADAKPWQLRLALTSSARFIPTAAAHEQGAGMINVGAAWDLLKAKRFKEVDIVSRAAVNTVLSDLLTPPNQGPGIYEREGWAPGDTGTRQLTLTRTNGGQSNTYQLSWTGNDGTFGAVPATVNLKNGPATLNIVISPASSGVHSAILNVDDPTTGGIEYRILNTIVAAEELTESTGWTATKSGSAARADRGNFLFSVPESAVPQALRTVTDITDGRIRVPRYHPWGVPIDSAASAPFCTGGTFCDPFTQALTNPAPGAWELATEVSRTSVPAAATFMQTATLISVSIDPASWTEDPAVLGTEYTQPFTFTNNRASFTGGAVGTALASALLETKSIGHLETQFFEVEVVPGATSLNAKIGNTSDIGADLDLFVVGPNGESAQSADADSEEEVTINAPAAGTWVVIVDGFSVPAGTTTYDYLDAVANPAYGAISITDPPAPRGAGASWSATASVTPLSSPGADRILRGFVDVREGAGVLARAEVQLHP